MTATSRAIGRPRPGFWARFWGNLLWFSGVSGMLTVVRRRAGRDAPRRANRSRPGPPGPPPDSSRQSREEADWEASPGFAIGAGVGRARGLAAGDEGGDQARDGAAGVVGAEDLAEEGPEGDARGEGAIPHRTCSRRGASSTVTGSIRPAKSRAGSWRSESTWRAMGPLVVCCNGGLLVVEPEVVNQPELIASEAVVLQAIASEWVTLQEVPFESEVV